MRASRAIKGKTTHSWYSLYGDGVVLLLISPLRLQASLSQCVPSSVGSTSLFSASPFSVSRAVIYSKDVAQPPIFAGASGARRSLLLGQSRPREGVHAVLWRTHASTSSGEVKQPLLFFDRWWIACASCAPPKPGTASILGTAAAGTAGAVNDGERD